MRLARRLSNNNYQVTPLTVVVVYVTTKMVRLGQVVAGGVISLEATNSLSWASLFCCRLGRATLSKGITSQPNQPRGLAS